MKKLILAIALLALSAFAQAQAAPNTATVTFIAPTTHLNDGTPITGVLTYNIYQGIGPGTTKTKLAISPATTTTVVISTGLLSNTNYCWQVTAMENGGPESLMSNEACKAFPASPPNTVTGVTAR